MRIARFRLTDMQQFRLMELQSFETTTWQIIVQHSVSLRCALTFLLPATLRRLANQLQLMLLVGSRVLLHQLQHTESFSEPIQQKTLFCQLGIQMTLVMLMVITTAPNDVPTCFARLKEKLSQWIPLKRQSP
mmetsp:Transcript_5269/g.18727  ORF Transcript_5269/g.18727 Transcript_5269/m.18727 type:complete len:132 (+) Transcript_5269:103-498(+)